MQAQLTPSTWTSAMIIGFDNNSVAERHLPLLYDGTHLRVGRASENLPSGTLTIYEDHGDTPYTELTNAGGRFFYQPSRVGNGFRKNANGTWNSQLCNVMEFFGSHYSPATAYFPSVTKSSSGSVSVLNGSYNSDGFLPYLVRNDSSPPLHDNDFSGYDVVKYTYQGDWHRANLEDTPWKLRTCRLQASAFFLAIVHGSVSFPTKAIRFNVNCRKSDGSYGDNYCSQTVTTDEMLRNGNDYYVLIKSGTFTLEQDAPYSSSTKQYIIYPKYIDQPRLQFTLGNGSALALTSWGYDVWPLDYT